MMPRPAGSRGLSSARRTARPATNDPMRLFVAIAPPVAALDELDAATAPLRPAWPQLRWADRSTWHITLAFLGEVDEATAGRLGPRLERAAHRHPELALSIVGAGAFAKPARARVLWAGIGGHREALPALVGSVGAGCRRAGAAPPDEGRPVKPHLTLARCRVPADLRALVESLSGYSGTPWQAREICLVRSFLGGERPRYEVLGNWPLRPA
jgi:2'-5' RNA ligase